MSTRTGTTSEEATESGPGLKVEISVVEPDCPLADESRRTGRITDVRRSTASSRDEVILEEFRLEDDVEPEDSRMEEAFELPDASIYRLPRVKDRGCVCEVVESFNCVVSEVDADDGRLRLSFYAPDVDTVKEIVDALKDAGDDVSIDRLTGSGIDVQRDLLLVDASSLTDRQREIVEKAYEMGYFDHPKRANASEVADALGIAGSTFSEHLSSAESKLLEQFCSSS